jgi:hypothetical protein
MKYLYQCRATGVPPAPWGAARSLKGAAKDFEKYLKLLGFLRTNEKSIVYGTIYVNSTKYEICMKTFLKAQLFN